MVEMIFDVLVAVLMYFIPGYILLTWIDFPALRGLNRYLLALCVSLVITPFTFIVVGNIVHFQLGLWAWFVLVIFLGLGSWILHRTNRRVKVNFVNSHSPNPTTFNNVSHLEKWGVIIFIALFAVIANLPRMLMFFQGGNVMELGPYDETWHIQQLVAVARTGIPPANYFFPSIHLGYYYGSWIYPAILGNLPVLPVSLMRAMAIHSFMQTFAFLSIIYLLLQVNIRRPWVRLAGMCFFTVMGGFDLFAKLPGIDNIEFWIRDPSWLMNGVRTMQISQFFTLYMWVPHHLAGGMVTVLLILIYKNLDFPAWVKMACTGILFGFCLTTSPFVFIGLVIAGGIAILWNVRSLWRERARMWFPVVLGIVLFLLVAWSPILSYASHNSSLILNNFQISLAERFRGNTSFNSLIDKILTMVGLPLVAGAILIIDMGVMFILYIVWWIKHLLSRDEGFHDTQDIVLGFQPLVSLIFIFMVTDVGGGSNVAMRSMIPAQILITLAAVLVVDWMANLLEGRTICILIFFTDVGYVSYRISSKEPASLIFLTLNIGIVLLIAIQVDDKQVGFGWAILYFVTAFLFVIAKPQNAAMGIPLALLGYWLMRFIRPLKIFEKWRTQVALLLSFGLIAGSFLLFAFGLPRYYRSGDLWNSVFLEIVGNSQNPAQDLAALGLPPEMIIYKGTYAFSEGVNRNVYEDFQHSWLYFQIFKFYLVHPDRLFSLINSSTATSFKLRRLTWVILYHLISLAHMIKARLLLFGISCVWQFYQSRFGHWSDY